MPGQAIGNGFLPFPAGRIVGIYDVPFAHHVYSIRKPQIVVPNVIDGLVIIGIQIAVTIITVVDGRCLLVRLRIVKVAELAGGIVGPVHNGLQPVADAAVQVGVLQDIDRAGLTDQESALIHRQNIAVGIIAQVADTEIKLRTRVEAAAIVLGKTGGGQPVHRVVGKPVLPVDITTGALPNGALNIAIVLLSRIGNSRRNGCLLYYRSDIIVFCCWFLLTLNEKYISFIFKFFSIKQIQIEIWHYAFIVSKFLNKFHALIF